MKNNILRLVLVLMLVFVGSAFANNIDDIKPSKNVQGEDRALIIKQVE